MEFEEFWEVAIESAPSYTGHKIWNEIKPIVEEAYNAGAASNRIDVIDECINLLVSTGTLSSDGIIYKDLQKLKEK